MWPRKSRTLHYGPTRNEQRWVASRMGYLLKRTYIMSQDVHNAMLSRGFSGDVRTLDASTIRGYDYAWSLFVIFICAVALIVDHTVDHGKGSVNEKPHLRTLGGKLSLSCLHPCHRGDKPFDT